MTLSTTNLGYCYPASSQMAIHDISLDCHSGEKIVLTGPTGCGKSTLLRMLVGTLFRHGKGQCHGVVHVGERDIREMSPSERASAIALVSQHPKDQILSQRVDEELAFGMSSVGGTTEEMHSQIPKLLEAVDLNIPHDRNPQHLSGGQVQRLMIACALATGARVLCLDEPLAHLDKHGVVKLLEVLDGLSKSGVLILMVEHRISLCQSWANRILVMDKAGTLSPNGRQPHSVGGTDSIVLDRLRPTSSNSIWSDSDINYGFPNGLVIFEGQSLHLFEGEWVALVGANGSGKSTLLRYVLSHQQKLRMLMLPQEPALCLFSETVYEEIAYGPREWEMADIDQWVRHVAAVLDVEDLLEKAPLSLSAGQQLRVALAALLACKPEVICLDEPTVGQDTEHVIQILTAILTLSPKASILCSTHDNRLLEGIMDRHVEINEGQIAISLGGQHEP